ncbi:MAG: nucleotidyltransferase [Thermoplasmata archaeon]|nr:nucleotidyltransferase [Thermoplasmata archaeon]
MKCQYCSYEWTPRKSNPVSCPRCKRRFDYPVEEASDDVLASALDIERGFQRMVYVMSVITPKLEEIGITAVVIGGSAVEFYTRDWYATGDIDLAVNKPTKKQMGEVMENLGFKNLGRMWIREELNLYIEAPGNISDIDLEKITRVETDMGYTNIIGLEDIIIDRVQAAEHWKSESDREQAVRIGAMFYDDIDWKYIRTICKKEGSWATLDKVMEGVKDARKKL